MKKRTQSTILAILLLMVAILVILKELGVDIAPAKQFLGI